MTLLMWEQQNDAYAIMTDTLSVDARTGEPAIFHGKLYPMLWSNLVMAGTGSALLADRWRAWLERQPVYDLDVIDTAAPAVLSHLWEDICEEYAPTGTASSATIYHFTIRDGRTRTYTYRSTGQFASERNDEPGQFQKPWLGQRAGMDGRTDGTKHGSFIPFRNLDEMIGAACRIRMDQDLRPAEERVNIGGELYLTVYRDGSFAQDRVHVFDDRDEMAKSMLLRRGVQLWNGAELVAEPALEIA